MKRLSCSLLSGGMIAAGLLLAGCAEIQQGLESAPGEVRSQAAETRQQDEAAPATRQPQQQQQEATHAVTSPVRVTLDGAEDKAADAYGIYWDTQRRVSSTPEFVLSMDAEMGDFQRLIINIYEADDEGKETGTAWAITDFGGEQLLVPNRRVSLTNPGDVTIISPAGERVDSVSFDSGKTYIALFVVSASNSAHTHKVRFTVR